MKRILTISLSLKNAYRVNSILYMLQQTPIIKRFLLGNIYCSFKLKSLANTLSVIWEILSVFVVKLLYFGIMLIGAIMLYPAQEKSQLFLHIFVFLTLLGSFTNTYIFKPSKDKYYALVLLRMDTQCYAVSNYLYYILKTFIGFAIVGGISGHLAGLSILQYALIPFFVVSLKLIMASISLVHYERTKKAPNEDQINYLIWGVILLLLLGAYGLPALQISLPISISMAIMVVSILAGALSICKVFTFRHYPSMYREILTQSENTAKQNEHEQAEQTITYSPNVSSHRKGLDYLNDLFVKRHRKILWKSVKRITVACIVLTGLLLLAGYFQPMLKEQINAMLLRWSPSALFFVMYLVNRGGEFTKALYMNCDYSLLTFSFFKRPEHIFRLFLIRLHQIIKINLLPALTIGICLSAMMSVSNLGNGGNYLIIVVQSICLSIFFSIHYLLIYYLLQPYNMGTHVKSGDYRVIEIAPFFICLWIIKMDIPPFYLGTISVAMCVLYYFIAVFLVRRYASGTFRIRA